VEQLKQARTLSEQDGGGFLEVLTLWQDAEACGTGHQKHSHYRLLLQVSAGYGPEGHNDERWYKLDSEPTKWPEDGTFALALDSTTDQAADGTLAVLLGVELRATWPQRAGR
jgi:hypothetical protein